MTQQEVDRLAKKWRDGNVTDEERKRFEHWYRSFDDSVLDIDSDEGEDALKLRLYQWISEQGQVPETKPVRRRLAWVRYAAAILLVSTIAVWFLTNNPLTQKDQEFAVADIQPGGNRATLTLPDGSTISLSVEQSGIIIGDGITYLDGSSVLSELVSPESSEPRHGELSLLTLTTPRGGTYEVTLPDGSKVWLNANSTLRYPSRFSAKTRTVEVAGEAYFSVEKDAKRPFRVVSSGQEIEVVGTEFNLSAYDDEEVTKTTLVEGKVKVTNHAVNTSNMLMPGQQAITGDGHTEIERVDVSSFIAWKRGDIVLTDVPLQYIMKQISRWYDVEVVYASPIDPNLRFFGTVSRKRTLSTVLAALAATGNIQFELENQMIIINPKK